MRVTKASLRCLTIGLLLVTGGCGPGRGNGVATAGGTATPSAAASPSAGRDPRTDQDAMLKYAQCMREHGIEMPDPQFEGGGVTMNIPQGTDKSKVDAAHAQCKQLMPNGGQPVKPDAATMDKMRKFSQCMREHGLANFPDPGDDGGIQIQGDQLGIDPQSDAFKQAEQACSQYQPHPPGQHPEGPGTHQQTGTNA